MSSINWQQLKQIYPLNQLRKDLIDTLISNLRVQTVPAGHLLFDFNDSPDDYFYVLEGEVELVAHAPKGKHQIGPAEEQAAMPMPYMSPSPHRARTTKESRILLVDRHRLLEAMKQNETGQRRSGQGSYWDNLPPENLPEITGKRAAEKRDAPKPPPMRPERILLVEDHPTDAAITQMMLERLGYRPTWVRNFNEAIDAMTRERYDLVLLDVQLPGVDGFEATRRIHARWSGSRPRIVALTARALKGDREACLAAGMDDYISKPLSIHVLGAKLSSENWALVDPPVIKRFADVLGPTGIVQLIDTFVSGWPEMVAEVRGALEKKDAPALRSAAHSLKAAAETLGIRVIAGYSLKLEHLGQSGTLEGAPALLGQIDSVRQETTMELCKIRAGYSS